MYQKTGRTPRYWLIVGLAYFHRYGWMWLMLPMLVFAKFKYVLGIGTIAFAAWTWLGCQLRWQHIYCSFQNARHLPMTPDRANWDTVKKSDAWGIPALFMILGVALLCV